MIKRAAWGTHAFLLKILHVLPMRHTAIKGV